MRRHALVGVLAALALLSACGGGGGGTDGNRAAAAADPAQAASRGDKFNDYVKGYNTLVSTFGMRAQYQSYLDQRIRQKGINDSFVINVGWLDNALDELKAARAAKCDCRDLDAAGDRIVPVLERLVGRLKGLETYYASRAYLEDNLARGKREDPLVIADFQAGLAAMPALSDAIDAVQAGNDEAALADRKRDGDMVGYQGGLALQRSKALINLFDTPADARDPAKLQRGDALVAEIERALAETRTALAKSQGASDPEHGLRNSMYDSVADGLTGMVGHYRGLRRGNMGEYQMMVASYNDAIEHANLSD